jgi:thioredoxin-like negative regulator of GroEL
MTFQELKDAPGDTLVMFTGHKCPACDALKPIVSDLATEHLIPFVVASAADEINAVRNLGLRMVPALVLAGNGQAKALLVGAASRQTVEKVLRAEGMVD